MHALGIELWVKSMECPHRLDRIAPSEDNEPSAGVVCPDVTDQAVQGIRFARAREDRGSADFQNAGSHNSCA